MAGTTNSAQPTAGATQAAASSCLADHVSVPTVGAGEGVILTPGNGGDIRSVTPMGFAQAVFDANARVLEPAE